MHTAQIRIGLRYTSGLSRYVCEFALGRAEKALKGWLIYLLISTSYMVGGAWRSLVAHHNGVAGHLGPLCLNHLSEVIFSSFSS